MKAKRPILNPYFITGLIILLLNDFYLKYEYGNFLTGKLSDFAGLLIFPMFVAALIPKLRKYISFITAIGFIIWKLPLFTPVIDQINLLLPITIHRVVDYSDYIALLILPLSHYLINHSEKYTVVLNKFKYVSHFALLAIAFFAFCATSVRPLYWEAPKGTILINKSYTIKLSKDSIINSIKELGYNCDLYERDTISNFTYYQTDNIVRRYSNKMVIDTIANVKYQLIELKPNKTKLTIINVTLPEEGNIQSWKELKQLSEQYSVWLKDNLIEKID
ncbi:MAG: hypothetical protein E6767_01790 [Dysgonomonas sp.]|nr:hypothetical protein [Dysgonomonas sp.]